MRITLLFFLILFSFFHPCFSQNKIDRSKEEIKKGSDKPPVQTPAPAPSNSNRESYSTEEQTFGQQIATALQKAFLQVFFYSTVGNYEKEDHLKNRVTRYPFHNKSGGNYQDKDTANTVENQFRLDIDYQYLYAGNNLTGHYAQLNIRPFQFFYLQAQYRALSEANIDSANSHLSFYKFYFCYDRLRFKKVNIGWKMGATYVASNINKAGFSFGLDGEAFIFTPVSIYVSKEWSNVNRVSVNTFDIVGRYHINRYNFQIGYTHLKIGTPVYNYLSVGAGVML